MIFSESDSNLIIIFFFFEKSHQRSTAISFVMSKHTPPHLCHTHIVFIDAMTLFFGLYGNNFEPQYEEEQSKASLRKHIDHSKKAIEEGIEAERKSTKEFSKMLVKLIAHHDTAPQSESFEQHRSHLMNAVDAATTIAELSHDPDMRYFIVELVKQLHTKVVVPTETYKHTLKLKVYKTKLKEALMEEQIAFEAKQDELAQKRSEKKKQQLEAAMNAIDTPSSKSRKGRKGRK